MTKIAEENVTDPARVQDCLSNILSTSDFLLELVNNVLDMSKLEAGEAETEHEPFDLRDVLQSAGTVISAQVADCGIAFTADTPEGTHWRLRGSPLNIQRVLQNIMSNAVKYNRPGGSVHVSCRETACENGTATFVFTCAGSGLSLAIAKKTVELLGGNISFVSREGEGTTFTVTLPLTVDTSYRPPAPEPEAGARLDGIRILMAEDNALNREIATYMLEERGALVTAAEDGQKTVDCFIAAAPGSFDAILMDIMMPVLDGLGAARAIRAIDRTDAGTVLILAVSANAFADDIAASRAAGMNDPSPSPSTSTALPPSSRSMSARRPEVLKSALSTVSVERAFFLFPLPFHAHHVHCAVGKEPVLRIPDGDVQHDHMPPAPYNARKCVDRALLRVAQEVHVRALRHIVVPVAARGNA